MVPVSTSGFASDSILIDATGPELSAVGNLHHFSSPIPRLPLPALRYLSHPPSPARYAYGGLAGIG